MPARLIDEQRTMPSRGYPGRDLGQMEVHRGGVAPGQDQARRSPALGTDRAEDVGGCGALILRGRGPRATPCPAPADLILLAYTGLISEPDLDITRSDARRVPDRVQARWEIFLKASMAPAAWAW